MITRTQKILARQNIAEARQFGAARAGDSRGYRLAELAGSLIVRDPVQVTLVTANEAQQDAAQT